MLDDLWEWDGTSWVQISSDVRPLARYWAAMAYDPFRKSLILYGGESNQPDNTALDLADTWEWQSSTRKWSQLSSKSSPGPQGAPGMVTDTGRGKVLLLTVDNPSAVWEWDGASATWTNRTPVQDTRWPSQSWSPLVAFDDGRQKMILFDNATYGQGTRSSAFWEWDPISAGWASRNSGDFIDLGSSPFPILAYDSLRRRQVLPTNATTTTSPAAPVKTWELDANGPTWYRRDLPSSPASLTSAAMAFDNQRGVMVLFGAGPYDGSNLSETWEYKVTNLGNGQGCTAATATSCASGFCADGVCCAVAACSGTCQSCAVAGHEGTCSPVVAGTEVPGSCAPGQACDSSGGCKAKNGTACSGAGACASGICVDGVCCESACDGLCSSCNQANRAGKCSAYALGTDPELECGVGDGACRTTCNGAGACDYPQSGTACGTCRTCDGSGLCSDADPSQCGTGGTGGAGGAGGTGAGGAGGQGGGGGLGGAITGGAGGFGGTIAGGVIEGGARPMGGTPSGGAGGQAGASGLPGGGGGTDGGIAGGAGGGISGGAGGTSGGMSGGASGSSGTGGARSSPDGGRDLLAPDAGSADGSTDSRLPDTARPDGRTDSQASDTGLTMRLGHKGCNCSLGQKKNSASGLLFALLGAALLLRARSRPRR